MKVWDIIFEIKDNLNKANARMDELQKRVEALNKPTQADDVYVLFEISVDVSRSNHFLVIYGKYSNGYFCCIPNWNVSCEMADPFDVFYNRSKLVDDTCIGMTAADAIAKAIRETHKKNIGASV